MTSAPDVVVVGGGAVGICTALYLQRSGRDVTVIERHTPGDGASGHNGAIFSIGDCSPTGTPAVVRSVPHMLRDPLSPLAIRWPYLPRIAPWLVRFALASRATSVETISTSLHSLMSGALDAYAPLLSGTEAEMLVRRTGLLHAYRSEQTFAKARFGLDLKDRRGISYDILDDAELTALDPALAGRFHRAIHLPDACFTTDPGQLTRSLAAQFVAGGGELRRAEVKGFETNDGVVRAVEMTGERLPTGAVVIAAGAWSKPLVRRLGLKVPLDTERGYGTMLTNPGLSLRLPVILSDFNVGVTPTTAGLRVAGLVEFGGLTAPPNFALADRAMRAAHIAFPELRTDGATRWMSYRPSLPDSLPIIDRAPRYPNALLAFGHAHKGLCQAAITGRLIQELADDKPPSVDLRPFAATRFSRRPGQRKARRLAV